MGAGQDSRFWPIDGREGEVMVVSGLPRFILWQRDGEHGPDRTALQGLPAGLGQSNGVERRESIRHHQCADLTQRMAEGGGEGNAGRLEHAGPGDGDGDH